MSKRLIEKNYLIASVLFSSVFLSACNDDDSKPTAAANTPVDNTPAAISYEVTVINSTNNQPYSPVAVLTHSGDYSAWTIGSAASVELEYIAEQGSNKELLAAVAAADVTAVSGVGLVMPGKSETITITAGAESQTLITVATMLVNTNDAFVGLNALDVSGLASGETMTQYAHVYDAGTELNSELKGTMPGPADQGEGFNALRDDIADSVRGHGGVVSFDDGLMNSVLNQSHRFDNPGLIVTITRR